MWIVAYLDFGMILQRGFLANEEQIDKAKELIKKLAFPFSSENFENPRLQHHYANVEAMALDRDMPEDVPDFTSMCCHPLNCRVKDVCFYWV